MSPSWRLRANREPSPQPATPSPKAGAQTPAGMKLRAPRLNEDNGGERGAPLLCQGSRGTCLLHSEPRCHGPGPTDRPKRRAARTLQTDGAQGLSREGQRASYLPFPFRALPRAFPLFFPLPLKNLLLLLQFSLSNFFNRSRSVSHFAGGSAEQGGAQRPVPEVQVAAAQQMRYPGGGRRDAPPPARPASASAASAAAAPWPQ